MSSSHIDSVKHQFNVDDDLEAAILAFFINLEILQNSPVFRFEDSPYSNSTIEGYKNGLCVLITLEHSPE